MDSAKDLAREMLDTINIDDSGLLTSFAKGVISFPVSMFYLGYDVFDTGNRRANRNDKFRLAQLIERGTFRRDIFVEIFNVFISDFTSRVDAKKTASSAANLGAGALGSFMFSQTTGIKLGAAISERAAVAFISGMAAGTILYIGAEASRAIYTSRALRDDNPRMYQRLRDLGDLDLLYFLVQNKVEPFEKACLLHDSNSVEFDRVCDYFFNGL